MTPPELVGNVSGAAIQRSLFVRTHRSWDLACLRANRSNSRVPSSGAWARWRPRRKLPGVYFRLWAGCFVECARCRALRRSSADQSLFCVGHRNRPISKPRLETCFVLRPAVLALHNRNDEGCISCRISLMTSPGVRPNCPRMASKLVRSSQAIWMIRSISATVSTGWNDGFMTITVECLLRA
jgi:hypothetical protein